MTIINNDGKVKRKYHIKDDHDHDDRNMNSSLISCLLLWSRSVQPWPGFLRQRLSGCPSPFCHQGHHLARILQAIQLQGVQLQKPELPRGVSVTRSFGRMNSLAERRVTSRTRASMSEIDALRWPFLTAKLMPHWSKHVKTARLQCLFAPSNLRRRRTRLGLAVKFTGKLKSAIGSTLCDKKKDLRLLPPATCASARA